MTRHTRWRGIALAHGYSSADCRWFARRARYWMSNGLIVNRIPLNQYAEKCVAHGTFPSITVRRDDRD